jgi:hypothetical protein
MFWSTAKELWMVNCLLAQSAWKVKIPNATGRLKIGMRLARWNFSGEPTARGTRKEWIAAQMQKSVLILRFDYSQELNFIHLQGFKVRL